jgi:hypothetical protein
MFFKFVLKYANKKMHEKKKDKELLKHTSLGCDY